MQAAQQTTAPIMIAATGPVAESGPINTSSTSGREQDRADRHARHGIVGRADEAGHVRGDRAEQEARDDHDDRHRHADRERADDVLVEHEQRQREQHDADQHALHRQVALGVRDHRPRAGARRGEPALDTGQQRFAQAEQRPETADQHRTDAEVANLPAPKNARGVFGVEPRDGARELRIAVEPERGIERDRDVPRDDAAEEHDGADVEPDDVADREQRRREVRAEVRDAPADVGRGCGRVRNQAETARRRELQESAAERRATEDLDALGRVLAGLEHLGRRLAFRKCEPLIDDQRASQRHREQHAEEPAEPRDRERPRGSRSRPRSRGSRARES